MKRLVLVLFAFCWPLPAWAGEPAYNPRVFDQACRVAWGFSAEQIISGGGGGGGSSAHNLLSSTHSDTTAASVARGSVIVGRTSGGVTSWTRVTVGAAGTLLRSDGTDSDFGNVALATDVTGTLPVGNGGTGLTSGTSGGILYFSAATTLASSAALAANQLVLGGGAGTTPATLGSLGTTTTLLHGNAAGAPTFGAVTLTTDVTGILPSANGGTANAFFTVSGPATSAKTFTFPNANATVLTDNAAVTVAQGGTGVATLGDAGVLIGNGTSAVQVTSAGTAGQVLTSNGAGVDPTFQAAGSGAVTLLCQDSGSRATNAGTANVSTCAISGLTVKDTLRVQYVIGNTVAAGATWKLHNSTDTVDLGECTIQVDVVAGDLFAGTILEQTKQTASTTIVNETQGRLNNGGVQSSMAWLSSSTVTTAWTGSWNLVLRAAGAGSAGGVTDWKWKVYKEAGQ